MPDTCVLSTQAWINTTVRYETATNGIALDDLVSGKPEAFVSLHTAAMVSLVTDPVPVTATTVPETLLFDVSRIYALQREFGRIVDGATVLIIANHALAGGDKHSSQAVLNDLAALVIGGSDFDTLSANLDQKLTASNVLVDPSARGRLLRALESGVANKKDPVRQLM